MLVVSNTRASAGIRDAWARRGVVGTTYERFPPFRVFLLHNMMPPHRPNSPSLPPNASTEGP